MYKYINVVSLQSGAIRAFVSVLQHVLWTPFLSLQKFFKNCFLPNSHINCICDIVMSLSEASSQKVEQEAISCQFANWRLVWKQGERWSDDSLILHIFFHFSYPLKFCLTSFRVQVSNKLQAYRYTPYTFL